MARRLDGLNPLAYVGVKPITPPNMLVLRRAPTPTDSKNVQIGTFWLHFETQDLWLLVSLDGNVATWVLLASGGSGFVQTLTGNTGGPVFPTANNINVIGDVDTGVIVNGNPGTSTLTISIPDQAFAEVTTTDDTPTVLYSFTPVDDSIISLSGFVIGVLDTFTGGIGGECNGTARKEGANPTTMVESSSSNFSNDMVDPTGNFYVDLNGNDVCIFVVGINGGTINWRGRIVLNQLT